MSLERAENLAVIKALVTANIKVLQYTCVTTPTLGVTHSANMPDLDPLMHL